MRRIDLKKLSHETIIGINPEERLKLQPLLTHLKLEFAELRAAQTGLIEDTFDYSLVPDLVGFIWACGRFGLLECAGEALAQTLLQVPLFGPLPSRISLQLHKPRALKKGAVVSYTLKRERGAKQPPKSEVYSVLGFKIKTLIVAPGQSLTPPSELIRGYFINTKGLSNGTKSVNAGAYAGSWNTIKNTVTESITILYCEGTEAFFQAE